MTEKPSGAPAILLIVSGVIGLLYSLFYTLWTGWPLMVGVMMVVSAFSDKGAGDAAVMGLVTLSMPLIQIALFVACVLSSVLTLFAGVRFLQFRSKGLVWLGLICSVLTPLVGAAANGASMLNCGTCGAGVFGCMLGNVGTAPVFVIGLVAMIVGAVMIMNPEYDAAFEENGG